MEEGAVGDLNRKITVLAETLGTLLAGRSLYVSSAESCTGGWVAQAITQIPGSSGWFDRGYIPYSNEAKREMLSVRIRSLQKYGAVSEQVVREMALGALKKSRATFSVAISGVAGPGGETEHVSVGEVWFAWGIEDQVDTSLMCFSGDRHEVRQGTVIIALQGLITRIHAWLDANEAEPS